jgi:type II secretory pathway component PulJ
MRRLRGRPGFTLTELLILTGLAGLLMMALVAMVVGHGRSRGEMEAVMKLQDDWTRVQFLLDQDIEESISSSASTGACAAGARLTLTVAGTNQPISYYLDGTNLRSFGPTITALAAGVVSDRGERICRERKADLPPGTTAM